MHYFALHSSLPMLKQEESPGITPEEFLSACSAYVKGKKFEILETLNLDPLPDGFPRGTLAGRYAVWESALRNALARMRANRLGTDASKFVNRDAGFESDAERAVTAAYSAANPLERERVLDRARWNKLEELEQGRFFSFDMLCAYKLKLLLCGKWIVRTPASAEANLDAAAQKAGLPAGK